MTLTEMGAIQGRLGSGFREGRSHVFCFGDVKGKMSTDIQEGMSDSGWMGESGAKKDATVLAY